MVDELQINILDNIKFDSVYSWNSTLNPSNTLSERIRRRVEIHELCVEFGYPMPRVYEELLVLKKLAEQSQELDLPSRKIIQLETI
jgi:hypothetical protein